MKANLLLAAMGAVCCCFAATTATAGTAAAPAATTISGLKLSQVMPGISTKTQVQSLLGAPWRIVQFNDCGHALPGQADETWDYRGKDSKGTYRIHIEFDDNGVANLVAKIPDKVRGGKGTIARAAPGHAVNDTPMSAKMSM
jgi:outer membrane protein assembly factor BamE (lipoprotein component of BamABCDE complex)